MTDFQFDLGMFDNPKIRAANNGYRYLLMGICVLSKTIFGMPLKTKEAGEIIKAFEKIFSELKYTPVNIFTDRGTEFINKRVKDYLKSKGINAYTSQNQDIKAGVVERAIRNFKGRLYKYFENKNTLKWIDVYQKIFDNINRSYCRVTKLRPIDVNTTNQQDVWDRLFKSQPPSKASKAKFNVGDFVRIPYKRDTFSKGYQINYTDAIKKVVHVYKTNPVNYGLEDENGKRLKERFYQPQLIKVDMDETTTFRVEKVIKTRIRKGQKEFFVKWVNYGDNHNSWVSESDFVN